MLALLRYGGQTAANSHLRFSKPGCTFSSLSQSLGSRSELGARQTDHTQVDEERRGGVRAPSLLPSFISRARYNGEWAAALSFRSL